MIRTKFCRSQAEQILTECGISEPPVPIDLVVQRHGFRLVARSDWERAGSRDARILPDRALIEYDARGYWPTVRFSIAHELGHYVLRHGIDTFAYTGQEDTEGDALDPDQLMHREAELFAAHLLMPRQWLTQDVKRNLGPSALQKRYEVSKTALWIAFRQYRLLGLIRPN
jgi:hypothetical protein